MTKSNLELANIKTEPTFCELEIPELRKRAVTSGNRLYARACNMMIACKEAKLLGDLGQADTYYKQAKTAYLQSLEDEAGQVRRVREVKGAIGDLGRELEHRKSV